MNAKEFFSNDTFYRLTGRHFTGKGSRPKNCPVHWNDLDYVRDVSAVPLQELWVCPPQCSGGDYTPSLRARVNYLVAEGLIESEGLLGKVATVCGTAGGFSIAIRADVDNEELFDLFRGLENHPVADDDLLCELEEKSKLEHRDTTLHDFFGALSIRFGVTEDFGYDVDDMDALGELFDSLDVEWANEQGLDLWVDLEKAAEQVDVTDFAVLLKRDHPFSIGFYRGHFFGSNACPALAELPDFDGDAEKEADYYLDHATEVENHDRSIHPFEHTAQRLNNDAYYEEAWEAFDSGVYAGMLRGLEDLFGSRRESLLRQLAATPIKLTDVGAPFRCRATGLVADGLVEEYEQDDGTWLRLAAKGGN